MKKYLVLSAVMLLLPVSAVFAAPSAQVSVTVTITQSVSVAVTPSAYAFGSADAGQTLATAVDAFTATNDGNGLENLTISVANSADWSAGTAAGADVFAMNFYNGSGWSLINPATGSALVTGLTPAASGTFGLQLLVPSSTVKGGVEQSINVTVTAAAQ